VKDRLRNLDPEDREPLHRLLLATGVFRPEEVEVAMELVDAALGNPRREDYAFRVAGIPGDPRGYACWGPTPCTRGTFDLYWIAVHPNAQGTGLGRVLMAAAEENMRRRGGRLCIVETSSLPSYDGTRRFYLSVGYAEEARIRDFYGPGDDRVIYTKRLTPDPRAGSRLRRGRAGRGLV